MKEATEDPGLDVKKAAISEDKWFGFSCVLGFHVVVDCNDCCTNTSF